jgi:hypothetical protein
MTHYCASQHQVLDLHKAQSLKIKIDVHKHGFLTIGMQGHSLKHYPLLEYITNFKTM